MESDFERKIALLAAREPAFPAEAFMFVSDAVEFTVSRLDRHRHVSAAELLDGMRLFAVKEYGAVASAVLESWGLKKEDDAGKVVYLLIGAGLLRASEDDSPDEFITGAPLVPPPPPIRVVRRKSDNLPFIV
ncbi:MAG: hypothetical protein IJC27_09585 [Lentisphaeria bacterium]|nr:hypothetical protein [Lentisphaeria bacterium]